MKAAKARFGRPETAMKKQEALRLLQLATPFKKPRKVEHTVSPEGVKLQLVQNYHNDYLYTYPILGVLKPGSMLGR